MRASAVPGHAQRSGDFFPFAQASEGQVAGVGDGNKREGHGNLGQGRPDGRGDTPRPWQPRRWTGSGEHDQHRDQRDRDRLGKDGEQERHAPDHAPCARRPAGRQCQRDGDQREEQREHVLTSSQPGHRLGRRWVQPENRAGEGGGCRAKPHRARNAEQQCDAAQMHEHIYKVLHPRVFEANHEVFKAVAEQRDRDRIAGLWRGQAVKQGNARRIDDQRIVQYQIDVVPVHEPKAQRLHKAEGNGGEQQCERDPVTAPPGGIQAPGCERKAPIDRHQGDCITSVCVPPC